MYDKYPQTQDCDSGRAGDRNRPRRQEGAAGAVYYRRAGCQSAGETLSVARRAYRAVVKDPAPWGMSKPTGGPPRRRRLAPSAQEPSGANRRRLGRRTRPEGTAGEVATSSKPPRIGQRLAEGGAVIKERCFSLNLGRSRTRSKKVGGPCTTKTGRPAKKRGVEGGEKRGSGLLSPRAPRLQSAYRASGFAACPCRSVSVRVGPCLLFFPGPP